jgi:hypothetical protein
MEEKENAIALRTILDKYGVPDRSIVGKLPRGGIQLDFVGHADITKILIEVDPMWWWEPAGWDNGRPAIHVVNGMAVMWGHLYVHNKQMLGVGTVKHDKADLDKELVGDFLRNAAMRFGICLSLWTKQEWETQDTPTKTSVPKTAPAPSADEPLSAEQIDQFCGACAKSGLNPKTVATNAGIDLDKATVNDLPKLRASFNDLKAFKDGK